MDRVLYVKASFKPVGEYKVKQVPTGEKKKQMFGEKEIFREEKEWVQTGYSDREVDGIRLAEDLQQAIEKLNSEGYEVISVTPVTSGDYNWKYSAAAQASYGYGYGFSYTEGLIVVGRKVA